MFSPSQNGRKPKFSKRANWRTCAEVEPRELLWLWPGKIPLGLVTICAGDPSLGKTLMMIDCMARGSRGENFLDGCANNIGVFETVFLSAEDDPTTIIVPRLMAANADLRKIHLVDTVCYFNEEHDFENERMLTLEEDVS